MNMWIWVTFAWLVTGCALVALLQVTMSGSGPLSQKGLHSLGYTAGVVAGAPFLLAFLLWVFAGELWRGRLPITGRAWWLARSRRFDVKEEEETWPSRDSALCRMLDLRIPIDPRLRWKRSAGQWPLFEVWKTTEAMVLETVEQHHELKEAGLSDHLIFEKIETFNAHARDADLPADLTLRSYLISRLQVDDPEYLKLAPDLLDRTLAEANDYVRRRRAYDQTQPAFPPESWLIQRTSIDEVEKGLARFGSAIEAAPAILHMSFRRKGEWEALKARMLADDELWTFSSSRESWADLAGRQGIALVRKGRPVRHIVTAKN